MDCQGLSLWERWHCVSNDGEGEDADGNRKKPIDKSHKKRYILSINAMRKSARCFCRSESRSPAANPVRPCGVLSLLSRSGEPEG